MGVTKKPNHPLEVLAAAAGAAASTASDIS